jgi:hypothetical protein
MAAKEFVVYIKKKCDEDCRGCDFTAIFDDGYIACDVDHDLCGIECIEDCNSCEYTDTCNNEGDYESE